MAANPIETYGLGRMYMKDTRDNRFPATALLPAANLPLKDTSWRMEPPLQQGNTPQCVDFSLRTCIMGSPTMQRSLKVQPGDIYTLARNLDEWPGESYDGTSVRAGEKAGVQLGLFEEYRWMTTIDDILQLLCYYGPVVIGSNWYYDMFHPDKTSTVHIGGGVAGGHAYCICAYDDNKKRVRTLNTWGNTWGSNGRAWITVSDLERLLSESGEAALPVQK